MSERERPKIDLTGSMLSPGSDTCRFCGDLDPYGPQKAIVAFGPLRRGTAAIVLCGTPHIICDLEEGGVDASDLWSPHDAGAEPFGIRVWEGRIVPITYQSTPDRPEEYDVEYPGEWRVPTKAEWASLKCGGNPFADAAERVLARTRGTR